MKRTFYAIDIIHTGRNSLKESASIFDEESIKCTSLDAVREELKDRYSKIPKGSKIYRDQENGEVIHIGHTYSYWNNDHHNNRWYQTDWITISKVEQKITPVILI